MFLQICFFLITVDLLCEATQIKLLSLCHSIYSRLQHVQRTIQMYFLLPAIFVCKHNQRSACVWLYFEYFSDTIFNVTGLIFYVHFCQQYFFSGEAGKPGFLGGRCGFPGIYHKYNTVQYSTQV